MPNAVLRYLADGPRLVGATTLEEQAWCRWFAAEVYTAAGAIVELGPWLGSLTASYCEGLLRNSRTAGRRKLAFAYDLFEWAPIYEDWSRGSRHAGRFAPGDSFEAYFRELHRVDERFLTAVRADLATAAWSGEPIELLINDAAKSLRIADTIFRTFVPALIPDSGYVAHQDFWWTTNAYIQAFMYLARESFAYEHTVDGSTMAVFKNVRRFDPAVLRGYDLAAGTLDEDLIRETFAWSGTLPDANPKLARLCEAVLLRDFGHLEPARRIVADNGLNRAHGDPQYDFQLATIRSWGYTDLVPGDA